MTGGLKRRFLIATSALLIATVGVKARVPWDELAPGDWLFELATRFSTVDGHRVHYKTPTAELKAALERRPEHDALRHLAQAQMDLGQRDTAIATMERWAQGALEAKGEAYAEAANWASTYGAHEAAFRFADVAVDSLHGSEAKAMANQRVTWAELHPELRDKRAMQRAALELDATDWITAYHWVVTDIDASNLSEAETGLSNLPKSTPAEPALVLKARLRTAQQRAGEVLADLEAAIAETPKRGRFFARAYVDAIDQAARARPEEWRETLATRFDAAALARLFLYFKGQERGDAMFALLQQMDRRHQKDLDRAGWSLLSSFYAEIDAVPEAFRARLAAATFADARAAEDDLVDLARLALRAFGRPLAWGNYSDADYRFVARMDPTPGFWTGGLAVLLTGQDWTQAFARIEAESVPERTFAVARTLLAELAKRNPSHPEILPLTVDVMQRHVDRGEGREALALLKDVEARATEDVRRRAQAIGILALRQTQGALAEEMRLYKAQLALLAADGTSPRVDFESPDGRTQPGDFGPLPVSIAEPRSYKATLDEAITRAEIRDRTHRTSIALMLGEMDRLKDAEPLWLDLARRLDAWNLDDEVGPRYEAALSRFNDPSWWSRLARVLARGKRQVELKALAEKVAATFRGSELLARAGIDNVRIEIPEQPRVGARTRLVPWGDWVILKALERFPHSPSVLRAAEGRLMKASSWARESVRAKDAGQRAVVPDALLDERRWAIFAIDEATREAYYARLMKAGSLESTLGEIERAASRTPVDELILAEGYARLSLFERSAEPASRLSAAYPGDPIHARQALTLHRSLASLDLRHEAPARAVVERATPALVDPNPLITELGELFEEAGRPEKAIEVWKGLLSRDPQNRKRIEEAATLLWDYSHMREALSVVETGRRLTNRKHLLSFEAGVLREEVKDIDGAIREYLNAVTPEDTGNACYCSLFEDDQRSLRRLAQLMGRARVRNRVLATVNALEPGNAEDEKTLLALWPLGTIRTPTAGFESDVDDWIDAMDQPNDPAGREEREAKREAARGSEHAGILEVARSLIARGVAMTPRATNAKFLAALEQAAGSSPAQAWRDAESQTRFFTSIVARQADLAPTAEERLDKEIALSTRLAREGRRAEAETLWQALSVRIGGLPQSAAKIRAQVAHAAFIEQTGGKDAARSSWDRLIAQYPWSLGVIEDRIAFLRRQGKAEDARQALEDAALRAAEGHDVRLLTRLVTESLGEGDAPRASRALDRLLGIRSLNDEQRLGAVSLQGRLRFQQDRAFAALAFANAEAERLPPERRAYAFAEVARAAFLEKAYDQAVTVWIEALNRNTQRAWISEAGLAARKGGRPGVLTAFFERQQQRAPRDVRWAIAVRDLRVATDDLPGGIAMAKIAASVRPERRELWDEGVELLERDARFVEAADFLEGWSVQRPDDSETAGRRAELYVRGGNPRRAVEVERASLAAFEATSPTDEALGERKAEVARRLWRLGEPKLAWRFLSEDGTYAGVASSALSWDESFQLAILNDQFVRMLEDDLEDEERRNAAASVLGQYGRIETREQVLDWLIARLFAQTRADETFLTTWWPFIENAGLEAALRLRVATRLASRIAGPWSEETPADFLDDAADAVIEPESVDSVTTYRVRTPDVDRAWAAHLVRFDRGADLVTFMASRVAPFLGRVRGEGAFDANQAGESWMEWLETPAAMNVFVRGLPSHSGLVNAFSSVFEDERAWARFVSVRTGWDTSALASAIRPESRTAWLVRIERPALATRVAEDPVLARRRSIIGGTSDRLSDLLAAPAGAPEAARAEFASRLMGPRTVGEILSEDPQFKWTVFEPRVSPSGDLLETGEDRVVGTGVERLRFPGALWGERAGQAWFALQAYTRYRAGDASAIDVPLEWPESGGETERAILTARLALALRGPAEAIARMDRLGLRTSEPSLLRLRLQLLVQAGHKADAESLLRQRIVAGQARMSESAWQDFNTMAEDLELRAPLTLLDPALPVSTALRALIHDRYGVEEGARFKDDDPIGMRAALAARWVGREKDLTPAQLRFWIRELWTRDATGLPEPEGLLKLGEFWRIASTWAQSLPVTARAQAVDAIDALPDTTRLDALPPTNEQSGARTTLLIRSHLSRGDEEAAVSLFRDALRSIHSAEGLALRAIPIATEPESDGEPEVDLVEGGYGRAYEHDAESGVTMALRALREPFLVANKAALVQRDLDEWLDAAIDREPGTMDYWKLKLQIAPESTRATTVDRLRRSYRRGDIATYRHAEITAMLVETAPAQAAPWIDAAQSFWYDFDNVRRHAQWLASTGRSSDAAVYVAGAREKQLLDRGNEIRAFDLWRRWAEPDPSGPETWKQALRFWCLDATAILAPLDARLREHPFDILSARATLRRPTAAPAQLAFRAIRALKDAGGLDVISLHEDEHLLRLRAARSLKEQPKAASAIGGDLSPRVVAADLERRRFRALDIDAALVDLATIAFANADRAAVEQALDLLDERKSAEARVLRAAFAAAPREAPVVTHRVTDGVARLLRPRDVTFAVVSSLVESHLSKRTGSPSASTPSPGVQP